MIGPLMQVDMGTEGGRFEARGAIAAVLEPWFLRRTLAEIRAAFDGGGVLWGPYQDFGELVREDPRCSAANPVFEEIEQPGVGRVLANGSPLSFSVDRRLPPAPAPRLGEHSEEVLCDLLGLPAAEYGRLHDNGIVAGPRRREAVFQ